MRNIIVIVLFVGFVGYNLTTGLVIAKVCLFGPTLCVQFAEPEEAPLANAPFSGAIRSLPSIYTVDLTPKDRIEVPNFPRELK
jgi:hypothetical protein